MTIKESIEAIIAARVSKREQFSQYLSKVNSAKAFINDVEKLQDNPGWQSLLDENEPLRREWKVLEEDVAALKELTSELVNGNGGELVEALNRINRDYLNLGCVGPWRTGKSTIISKLTGLDDGWIIPTSQYLQCTGTTINVFNGNEEVVEKGVTVDRGGNKAVIYFYSFTEIVSIINQYLSLFGTDTMREVSSSRDFESECVRLAAKCKAYPAPSKENKELYDTLMNYLIHATDYSTYLRAVKDYSITISDLNSYESKRQYRKYVSFYELTDEEYKMLGKRPKQIFLVLGVKKANVYYDFKICGEDVGKIQFLDTPGIGEARINVAESLASALRNDLDVAICLKKVTKGVEITSSIDFHNILKENVINRRPENWVFYLLNLFETLDNEVIKVAKDQIIKDLNKVYSTRDHIVPGISFKEDQVESHFAALSANDDIQELHSFFRDILKTMSSLIIKTDDVFFTKAVSLMDSLDKVFARCLEKDCWNVSRMVPVFDNRRQILLRIKALRDEIIQRSDILDDTVNEQIRKSLRAFYEEHVGLQFAKSFVGNDSSFTEETWNQMKAELDALFATREMTNKDRVIKRNEIIERYVLPCVNREITETGFKLYGFPFRYSELNDGLKSTMIRSVRALIENLDVSDDVKHSKDRVWRVFMSQLSFVSTSTSIDEWVNEFLRLLSDGGSAFQDLYKCVKDFHEKNISLQDDILSVIKSRISSICTVVIEQGSVTITNVNDHRRFCFEAMVNKEKQVKLELGSKYEENVGMKISDAKTRIGGFITEFLGQIVPAEKKLIVYDPIFEQLIKFYDKYYEFDNDFSLQQQKTAVQEWDVIRAKKY